MLERGRGEKVYQQVSRRKERFNRRTETNRFLPSKLHVSPCGGGALCENRSGMFTTTTLCLFTPAGSSMVVMLV